MRLADLGVSLESSFIPSLHSIDRFDESDRSETKNESNGRSLQFHRSFLFFVLSTMVSIFSASRFFFLRTFKLKRNGSTSFAFAVSFSITINVVEFIVSSDERPFSPMRVVSLVEVAAEHRRPIGTVTQAIEFMSRTWLLASRERKWNASLPSMVRSTR